MIRQVSSGIQKVCALARWCLGNHLTEGGKESVLMGRSLGVTEWYPHAQPEVVLVLPQGHTTESPQDHVMVGVVTGVPDGHILKHTAVYPKDVVYPGPRLLSTTEYSPHPPVPCLRKISR